MNTPQESAPIANLPTITDIPDTITNIFNKIEIEELLALLNNPEIAEVDELISSKVFENKRDMYSYLNIATNYRSLIEEIIAKSKKIIQALNIEEIVRESIVVKRKPSTNFKKVGRSKKISFKETSPLRDLFLQIEELLISLGTDKLNHRNAIVIYVVAKELFKSIIDHLISHLQNHYQKSFDDELFTALLELFPYKSEGRAILRDKYEAKIQVPKLSKAFPRATKTQNKTNESLSALFDIIREEEMITMLDDNYEFRIGNLIFTVYTYSRQKIGFNNFCKVRIQIIDPVKPTTKFDEIMKCSPDIVISTQTVINSQIIFATIGHDGEIYGRNGAVPLREYLDEETYNQLRAIIFESLENQLAVKERARKKIKQFQTATLLETQQALPTNEITAPPEPTTASTSTQFYQTLPKITPQSQPGLLQRKKSYRFRDILVALEKLGCTLLRIAGSHHIFSGPEGRTYPIWAHSQGHEIPFFAIKRILKKLGITKEDFIATCY